MKRRAGMRRTRLARRKGLNPIARTKLEGDRGYDLDRAAKWHRYVTVGAKAKRRPCVECGSLFNIEAHHVIAKQTIKRMARSEKWDWDREQETIWDFRNGIPVCVDCHQRHETAYRRISQSNVPPEAVEFADELGVGYLIERYYPE